MLISENQISEITHKDRKTIRARLMDVEFTPGERNAKLYESHVALAIIYGQAGKDGVTPQEAARQLTIKRTEEIELNMECTRRERIPLELVEEHNEQVLQNVAGIFKASEGKKLSPELIQEIFAEFRRMDEILADYNRKAPPPATQPSEDPMDDPDF